jgi:glycosyltransferase involved in cell wall biosynthesis
VRYLIVGDGPERAALEGLARKLGVAGRVELAGALPHTRALHEAWRCHLFVLPSVDEAFGVAYVEAMAGGLPAIGLRGEDGPEEIARAGEGLVAVEPGALAETIRRLLEDADERERLGREARATVEAAFTWAHTGRETIAAYEEALG